MSLKLFKKLTTKKTGDAAEAAAEKHLRKQGLKVLARQYRCKFGELDLVMRDANTLVFVEVRYRRRSNFGAPAETVGTNKQKHVIAAAQHYLQNNSKFSNLNCRFDVVAASPHETQSDSLKLEWIQDAFQC